MTRSEFGSHETQEDQGVGACGGTSTAFHVTVVTTGNDHETETICPPFRLPHARQSLTSRAYVLAVMSSSLRRLSLDTNGICPMPAPLFFTALSTSHAITHSARPPPFLPTCWFSSSVHVKLFTTQVGPHGAGLFHIIFTPDRAHLIELQIDQTTARKHFNNLAKWSGHGYTSRGGPNPVSVEGTQAMVRQAINEMDLTRH